MYDAGCNGNRKRNLLLRLSVQLGNYGVRQYHHANHGKQPQCCAQAPSQVSLHIFIWLAELNAHRYRPDRMVRVRFRVLGPVRHGGVDTRCLDTRIRHADHQAGPVISG